MIPKKIRRREKTFFGTLGRDVEAKYYKHHPNRVLRKIIAFYPSSRFMSFSFEGSEKPKRYIQAFRKEATKAWINRFLDILPDIKDDPEKVLAYIFVMKVSLEKFDQKMWNLLKYYFHYPMKDLKLYQTFQTKRRFFKTMLNPTFIQDKLRVSMNTQLMAFNLIQLIWNKEFLTPGQKSLLWLNTYKHPFLMYAFFHTLPFENWLDGVPFSLRQEIREKLPNLLGLYARRGLIARDNRFGIQDPTFRERKRFKYSQSEKYLKMKKSYKRREKKADQEVRATKTFLINKRFEQRYKE